MKSEKITVSLPSETVKIANEKFTTLGFENRSEFINVTIREYVSRDILRQFSGELAQFYSKIEHSEIKLMEQHISKLFYKIAVEQAQLYLLLASAIELPADYGIAVCRVVARRKNKGLPRPKQYRP